MYIYRAYQCTHTIIHTASVKAAGLWGHLVVEAGITTYLHSLMTNHTIQ